jgi:hypothetical protein
VVSAEQTVGRKDPGLNGTRVPLETFSGNA